MLSVKCRMSGCFPCSANLILRICVFFTNACFFSCPFVVRMLDFDLTLNRTVLQPQSHKCQTEGKTCFPLPLATIANTAQLGIGHFSHRDALLALPHFHRKGPLRHIMQSYFLASQTQACSGLWGYSMVIP